MVDAVVGYEIPKLTPKQLAATKLKARYAATVSDWDWVARRLATARDNNEPIGLDTEFDGAEISEFSPAGGACRIHVWSVAVQSKQLSPRGWFRASGFVLPESALTHAGIRECLEDDRLCKAVHNLPVDYHTLGNAGIKLRGGINTLSLARFVWPERKNSGEGFGLKELMPVIGHTPVGEFHELLSRPNITYKEKTKKVRSCACGVPGCKKKKGMMHEKIEEIQVFRNPFIPKNKPTLPVPLREIVPGHWLWNVLLPYAQEDAVAALELYLAARNLASGLKREVPWL
jgi:hypothetical protein